MIHQFDDFNRVPMYFDEETEKLLFTQFGKPPYKLILENGYLARKNNEKMEFFHRFVMKEELEAKGNHLHVHHKDGNKLNNKKENLELIEKEKHFQHHPSQKYNRSYSTWCEKVYGNSWDNDHYEEFDEWLEEKWRDEEYG